MIQRPTSLGPLPDLIFSHYALVWPDRLVSSQFHHGAQDNQLLSTHFEYHLTSKYERWDEPQLVVARNKLFGM